VTARGRRPRPANPAPHGRAGVNPNRSRSRAVVVSGRPTTFV
jgi:hypothetical protein